MKLNYIIFIFVIIMFGCPYIEIPKLAPDNSEKKIKFERYYIDSEGGINGLKEAYSAALSSDNKNVYIAGYEDDAIAVFERDEVTGELLYINCVINDINGVDGLDGVRNITVSPDNKSVYATGYFDSSIAVFKRDQSTGALNFTKCFKEGSDGINMLYGAYGITVSPDNKNVYATSSIDNSIIIFNRDTSTGDLTYQNCLTNGVSGVNGIRGAYSIAVSPDNCNVYTTGYFGDSLAVFKRDQSTGNLQYLTHFENGVGSVTGLDGAISVKVSPDNKNVYVAGYSSNSIVVFDRNTSNGELTYITHFLDDLYGVDGLCSVTDVIVSPDNKNVYAASFGDSAVSKFNRNISTGELTFSECYKKDPNKIDGLFGIYNIAVSFDNKNLYTVGNTDNAVGIFDRDNSTGALTYSSCIIDDTEGIDGLEGGTCAAVSPDNKNVYITGYNDHALAVFKRDTDTGKLTYITCFTNGENGVEGLGYPVCVAVSPDNKSVYTASHGTNSLSVFSRDTATGNLTYITSFFDDSGGVNDLQGASSIAVTPDNRYVYAAADRDNSISIFTRDTISGNLTYLTSFKNSTVNNYDLYGANSITVSPDNKNVYVTCIHNNTLAVFNRNLETGELTFLTFYANKAGLNLPKSITISPDNRNVYVAGSADDALVVFNRNTSTGELTYITCFRNGADGISGLDKANSVTVSPDNKNVYVTGNEDDALAVFNRDLKTGKLTFSKCFKDDIGNLDGLDGAYNVAVSPDSYNVYVTGFNDNALTMFITYYE